MGSGEKTTFMLKGREREYSDRNLKDKLWYEVYSQSSRTGVSFQLNRSQKNVC